MNQNPPANRGRILIADDEPIVRDALSGFLLSRGFTCTCAASGTEVVNRLRDEEFDTLITDLLMPGNDGTSLIEEMPQLAPGLPVIVLTGKPSVETAAKSIRLPVVAYLTKPPEFDELIQILDEAVLGHQTYRTMRAGQQHLQNWGQELDRLVKQCRAHPSHPGSPLGSYLRITLRNVILLLSELEQTTRSLELGNEEDRNTQLLDRDAALRRTVDVLRRTKQSFKSKELADLRRELERLIAPEDEPEATPAN